MSDMAGLHKLNPSSFTWFVSYAEANDWLPFDSDESEIERLSWDEPDRHTEWAHWHNKWEADGEPDFDA